MMMKKELSSDLSPYGERDFLTKEEKKIVEIFQESINLKLEYMKYTFNNSERREDLKKIEHLINELKDYLLKKNLI